MDRPEMLSVERLLEVHSAASAELDRNRGDRVDPLTANSHSDHFAHEVLGYVSADLARGRIEGAKHIVDFWLKNTAEDGRLPHMVVETGEPIGAEHWGPSVAATVVVTQELLQAQQANDEANR